VGKTKYWHVKHDFSYDFWQILGGAGPVLASHSLVGDQFQTEDFPMLDNKDRVWERIGIGPPDFPDVHGSLLSMRVEIFQKISKRIPLDVNIVKFKVDAEIFYTIVPRYYFDLFDMQRSNYKISSDGSVYRIQKVILMTAPQKLCHFFGLSGDLGLRLTNIVSSEFKSIVEEQDYKGLRFSPVF
jgi:hypothetical protein